MECHAKKESTLKTSFVNDSLKLNTLNKSLGKVPSPALKYISNEGLLKFKKILIEIQNLMVHEIWNEVENETRCFSSGFWDLNISSCSDSTCKF
jgi:hypothetical protein